MSEKRRDNKNRILRNGESQRSDGRYVYKYTDNGGNTKFLYSWRLVKSDSTPQGKRDDLPLREKIRNLNKELEASLIGNGGSISVVELATKYTSQKTGVKQTTRIGYNTVLNILKSDPFGMRRIDSVKLSDAKGWLIDLQQTKGRSYSSIHNIRGVLRPAFQMAVDDDLILKNPFQFPLLDVLVNDMQSRDAISKKDEKRFLEFIKNDNHFKKYYEGVFILFKTGLRISEFCGLTMNDIDFENNTIDVNCQLQYYGKTGLKIEKTKTNAGSRVLPMTKEVRECFESLIEKRPKLKVEQMIDGKIGFLYVNRNGRPLFAREWAKYFKHMREKFNKIYKEPIPHITPHVCRHTYCTNMAKKGINPKVLQYLMGHSEISITLDTYTHLKLEDAKNELKSMKMVE